MERVDFPERQAGIADLAAAREEARRAARGDGRCVPAAEGGAPRRHRQGISSTRHRHDRDARQAVVAPDASGEARGRLCGSADGNQATRLGRAQCRRRRLGDDLECARRTARCRPSRCSSTPPMSRKVDIVWASLEEVAAGLPLPAAFGAAIEKAKQEFFAADFLALRDRMMKMLVAGEKPEMTTPQWTGHDRAEARHRCSASPKSRSISPRSMPPTQRASAIWSCRSSSRCWRSRWCSASA